MTIRSHRSSFCHQPTARRACEILLLLGMLSATSCTAMIVADMATNAETDVSVTVKGEDETLALLTQQLSQQFEVETVVQAVEAGSVVLEIIGTYATVVDALAWVARQGVEVLANDVVSETVLTVAVALLK